MAEVSGRRATGARTPIKPSRKAELKTLFVLCSLWKRSPLCLPSSLLVAANLVLVGVQVASMEGTRGLEAYGIAEGDSQEGTTDGTHRYVNYSDYTQSLR